MKRFFAALPAFLIVAFPAAAQKESPGAPTFEGLVEVSEVLIDVLATDENGEIVRGLGKEDFFVEEDGEPVEIRSVSYYSTRYEDPAADAAAEEIPASRYFILFLEDRARVGELEPFKVRQVLRAGREAQRFVEEEMRGSDWMAVFAWDSRLKIYQDFTQDRESLLFAIEQALARVDPAKRDRSARKHRPPLSGTPSLVRHLPRGEALEKESREIYDTLRLVGEASGFIVGRKNLLLLTFGFGNGRSVGPRHFDERYYFPMETALNDHNVAVYPIHLGGRGYGQPQSHFLRRLAEDTGGEYYENLRDYLAPLTEIGEENAGYYVVSYQSVHPAGEIGYERIEVRARDEAIQVRARKGYRYGL